MTDGKLTDVLIDEFSYADNTGLQKFCNLTIWADPDMTDVIKNIPGVTNVYTIHGPTEYTVYLDPRYDREYLKCEIEAQIKINLP